ncbi:UvrD-helicase domain-containing protein [Chromobacterium violaceum]|uniref:UvrD-helicase domain-containing protein n=1 Tax=Chromobacterium violaceum TaxID=536 RepID=UPI001B33FBF8|nr:UvrD-helicase domain-containing protein [Chromobacterium violaceum]MBP4049375.1 UvrD-helicase domain-containing protein [Chromobacterium violaceum]
MGCWPIPGISITHEGERYKLDCYGETFYANGYIADLDMYVILGFYDGISKDEIIEDEVKLRPHYNVWDKLNFTLQLSNKSIRFIKNRIDCENLRRQLEIRSSSRGLESPSIEIITPGEAGLTPIFSALHKFGIFAENLGIPPQELHTRLSGKILGIEKDFIYAVSAFYAHLYKKFEKDKIVTFNQLFHQIGNNPSKLKDVDFQTLISMKNLMIDEFQDISPSIVKFVLALHQELKKRTAGEQQPTLICVGDDWQSIYGWRGSSPHFFLQFNKFFSGAKPEPLTMNENFRSSQTIINAAERFIYPIKQRSNKHGEARHPEVKDLAHPLFCVTKYSESDVRDVTLALLSMAGLDESVYILSRTGDGYKAFNSISDKRLTSTTIHQSKGLEAEYVILIGDCLSFGKNTLKNALYEEAKFPSTYDKMQKDEALRLAYVGVTRAKKICIWFGEPKSSGVLNQAPPDGITRHDLSSKELLRYIKENSSTKIPTA